MNFDVNYDASVFETTIRCVGGLLSAYDLSGDGMFLNKATELADRLLPAFNTPSGIPYNTINLQSGQAYNPGWTGQASTLADFGTEQMEFIGLSERTGDQKYRQKVGLSDHGADSFLDLVYEGGKGVQVPTFLMMLCTYETQGNACSFAATSKKKSRMSKIHYHVELDT